MARSHRRKADAKLQAVARAASACLAARRARAVVEVLAIERKKLKTRLDAKLSARPGRLVMCGPRPVAAPQNKRRLVAVLARHEGAGPRSLSIARQAGPPKAPTTLAGRRVAEGLGHQAGADPHRPQEGHLEGPTTALLLRPVLHRGQTQTCCRHLSGVRAVPGATSEPGAGPAVLGLPRLALHTVQRKVLILTRKQARRRRPTGRRNVDHGDPLPHVLCAVSRLPTRRGKVSGKQVLALLPKAVRQEPAVEPQAVVARNGRLAGPTVARAEAKIAGRLAITKTPTALLAACIARRGACVLLLRKRAIDVAAGRLRLVKLGQARAIVDDHRQLRRPQVAAAAAAQVEAIGLGQLRAQLGTVPTVSTATVRLLARVVLALAVALRVTLDKVQATRPDRLAPLLPDIAVVKLVARKEQRSDHAVCVQPSGPRRAYPRLTLRPSRKRTSRTTARTHDHVGESGYSSEEPSCSNTASTQASCTAGARFIGSSRATS